MEILHVCEIFTTLLQQKKMRILRIHNTEAILRKSLRGDKLLQTYSMVHEFAVFHQGIKIGW